MSRLSTSPSGRSNLLLRTLSQADRNLLEAHLEPVALEMGDVCINSDRPLTHVYFLDGGMGSTIMPDEVHFPWKLRATAPNIKARRRKSGRVFRCGRRRMFTGCNDPSDANIDRRWLEITLL